MNRWVVLAMVGSTATLATIVAVLTGDRQAVSIQIWVACFTVGFSVSIVNQLRARAPVAPTQRRSVLRRTTTPPQDFASRSRRLRILEGLVLRSRDNQRAFTQQLQPQLIELATHHMRVNHGIDVEDQPDEAVQALGDVGWLLDPTSTDRTPTLEELDCFIQFLEAPSHPGEAA